MVLVCANQKTFIIRSFVSFHTVLFFCSYTTGVNSVYKQRNPRKTFSGSATRIFKMIFVKVHFRHDVENTKGKNTVQFFVL